MASVAPPLAPSGRPAAFGKRGVLALVLVGTLAFVALLYFLGTDQMGGSQNNGDSHAASKGLTGFSALTRLLEADGYDVSTSRSEASLDDPALLVLTPSQWTNGDDLSAIIERRATRGPTLVILPKWQAGKSKSDKAKPGWVELGGFAGPFWKLEVASDEVKIADAQSEEPVRRVWISADGLEGELPASTSIQFLGKDAAAIASPIVTSRGRVLAGLLDQGHYDGGTEEDSDAAMATEEAYYSEEDSSTDEAPATEFDEPDMSPEYYGNYATASREAWRVMVVADPDLMNNWGMADESRANAALEIVAAAQGYEDLPIIFDLTTNGLGQSRNLLSLAFEPPFLAATLCLLVALLLVGWRAFRRFGPPLAEDMAFAFGKAQLVENGGGVIQRTGRMHLLTRPYAAMVESRIARKLGLRGVSRDTLDTMLARRGLEAASPRLAALESARHQPDIIRAARALHSLERTITR